MQGCVVWLTGLSGSGKTTLANSVALHLTSANIQNVVLDGDLIRRANPGLGFSRNDRLLQMSRVSEMARESELLGNTVLVALISPYIEGRQNARSSCQNFKEVYLSTPVSVCSQRDPKGLYKKAYANEIQNFTGVHDVYEIPPNPELTLDTSRLSIEESVRRILALIRR